MARELSRVRDGVERGFRWCRTCIAESSLSVYSRMHSRFERLLSKTLNVTGLPGNELRNTAFGFVSAGNTPASLGDCGAAFCFRCMHGMKICLCCMVPFLPWDEGSQEV